MNPPPPTPARTSTTSRRHTTTATPPPRIGLLGGTFDPVHRGHLRMARAAQRACHLSRIYFVPATHPWHKAAPRAGYLDRFAMLALALDGHPDWVPLHIPDPATGPANPVPATYSVDQVAWLHHQCPGHDIYFIVGADAFAGLPTWREHGRLLRMCNFAVLARAGVGREQILAALPEDAVGEAGPDRIQLRGGRQLFWLEDFRDRSSSTDVRKQMAGTRRQRLAVLPAAVDAYARRAHLY